MDRIEHLDHLDHSDQEDQEEVVKKEAHARAMLQKMTDQRLWRWALRGIVIQWTDSMNGPVFIFFLSS